MSDSGSLAKVNNPVPDRKPVNLFITVLGSWSVVGLWYPFWRVSAAQEAKACGPTRPSFIATAQELRQHPLIGNGSWRRGLYSGLPLTIALQPLVYPSAAWFTECAQRRWGWTKLEGQAAAGAILSPLICAPWKTWILASPDSRLELKRQLADRPSKAAKAAGHLLRAPGWWAGRNTIVVPCIFDGPRHLQRLLLGSSSSSESLSWLTHTTLVMLSGVVAAVASHPCDLMTGLLNNDPFRTQFRNSREAARELWRVRGWRGILVASPARIIVFSIEAAFLGPAIGFWQSQLH